MALDILEVEKLAKKELTEVKVAHAKDKIKGKLQQIDTAETVLKNLKNEYADLMTTLADWGK